VTSSKKDRRVAETRHEEKSAEVDDIIALPALTSSYPWMEGSRLKIILTFFRTTNPYEFVGRNPG
jgi:hypothetical protein